MILWPMGFCEKLPKRTVRLCTPKEAETMQEGTENIHFDQEHLRQRLRQIEAEIQAKEEAARAEGHKKPLHAYVLYAVAALVLVGVGAWVVRHSADNRLFRQYYEPYPNVVTLLERGHPPPDGGSEAYALQLYDQGQYEEALVVFEQWMKPDSTAPEVLFYAAIACIETSRLGRAEQYLKQVSSLANHDFGPQAQWYLALVHVRQNELRQARKQLCTLAASTETYRDKATRLLRDL